MSSPVAFTWHYRVTMDLTAATLVGSVRAYSIDEVWAEVIERMARDYGTDCDWHLSVVFPQEFHSSRVGLN